MSLQDLAQLIAALGGLAGVAAIVDGLRRRKRLSIEQGQAVANSAVALVERLERRTNTLEKQLDEARATTETLSDSLHKANTRAEGLQTQHDQMANSLADGQLEIRHLRLQIKSLSEELDRIVNNPGDAGRR